MSLSGLSQLKADLDMSYPPVPPPEMIDDETDVRALRDQRIAAMPLPDHTAPEETPRAFRERPPAPTENRGTR